MSYLASIFQEIQALLKTKMKQLMPRRVVKENPLKDGPLWIECIKRNEYSRKYWW